MNMNCKSCTGGSALAEKLVLWYIPLAFAALFIWGSVLQMRSFVINDADFGYFITQIWRVWNGWDWQAPFPTSMRANPFTPTIAPP